MWRIRVITNLESESGIDEEALNALREKRKHVTGLLNRILQDRPADEVRVQVPSIPFPICPFLISIPYVPF
jgi:hypothetical protein